LRFSLCTNGVLFDEQAWDDLGLEGRVVGVQISIDAAEEKTYQWVRRGGDFQRLGRNLEWLSGLRHARRVGPIDLLFVVQTCNYREMPDFVRWGKRLGVDSVRFMVIDHWQRGLSRDGYKAAKIWDAEHPEFNDFAELMRDEIFNDPIVRLGHVQAIREGWKPSDLSVKFLKQISPDLPG
jgi:MoaA/NifB/PqqE/SkfB family radical SAM enzyme